MLLRHDAQQIVQRFIKESTARQVLEDVRVVGWLGMEGASTRDNHVQVIAMPFPMVMAQPDLFGEIREATYTYLSTDTPAEMQQFFQEFFVIEAEKNYFIVEDKKSGTKIKVTYVRDRRAIGWALLKGMASENVLREFKHYLTHHGIQEIHGLIHRHRKLSRGTGNKYRCRFGKTCDRITPCETINQLYNVLDLPEINILGLRSTKIIKSVLKKEMGLSGASKW